MCLLYLKVICARPWGPKEAFGGLISPRTTLLTASFLRPFATGHTVYKINFLLLFASLTFHLKANFTIHRRKSFYYVEITNKYYVERGRSRGYYLMVRQTPERSRTKLILDITEIIYVNGMPINGRYVSLVVEVREGSTGFAIWFFLAYINDSKYQVQRFDQVFS